MLVSNGVLLAKDYGIDYTNVCLFGLNMGKVMGSYEINMKGMGCTKQSMPWPKCCPCFASQLRMYHDVSRMNPILSPVWINWPILGTPHCKCKGKQLIRKKKENPTAENLRNNMGCPNRYLSYKYWGTHYPKYGDRTVVKDGTGYNVGTRR